MSVDYTADPFLVRSLQRIEMVLAQKGEISSAIMKELWFLATLFRFEFEGETSNLQGTIKGFLIHFESLVCSDYKARGIDLLGRIKHFKEHNAASEYSYPGTIQADGTTPLSQELVVEYIDKVVERLLVTYDYDRDGVKNELEKMKDLVVYELRGIKKFVVFLGKICGSEDQSCWQNFLRHVEYVSTLAAIVFDLNLDHCIPDLLQNKMWPIQPHVRVIYTDVLRNLSRGSNYITTRDRALIIEAADEFIDVLIWASSLTAGHEIKTLAQQLNSLRIMFKELPLIKDIQVEMRIGFYKRLETAVIDAGLVVYSLICDENKKDDWDQELFLLYNKIEFVKTKIYYDIREWVQSNLPKNDALGFSNYLLENFKELLFGSSSSSSLAPSLKYQLEVVYEELQPLFNGNNNKHDDHHLVGRMADKAYEVEYIVDSLTDTESSEVALTYLTMWLSEITREIKLIKVELTRSKEEDTTSSSSNDKYEELVGFGDVRETIRGQLLGGSSVLDVVSIVGMAGSGKTTLARSFLNDVSIVSHFDLRAECRVSQEYIRKDLLLSLLSFADYEPNEVIRELPDDELADRLRRTLLTKRCLLIIDDVWDLKAWDDLNLCFRGSRNGSRIILTTRLKEVAIYSRPLTAEPHCLRPLSEHESWLLLQKKVFRKQICPEELKKVGQRIARKCNGLPLSVVLVAGLLSKMDKTERYWTRMELSFGEQIQDGAKDLVKLSYNDLPDKLKPCLLYFGAFLEDREISVSKLTSLWIAEAFIENDHNGDKCLEDIAEDYLRDLIQRNLVTVTKMRSIGKIKACRIHDLLLDFCKQKARHDNFLLWPKRDQGANPRHFYSEKPLHRRLSFCTNQDDLDGWRPSCSHARSILFREVSDNTCSSMGDASIIFGNFKFLRVLDLEFVVVESFPTGLDYLRYLAVQTCEYSIPESIVHFRNLQTLIVKGTWVETALSMPATFWNLGILRHVSISPGALFNLHDIHVDRNPSILENLATLTSVYVSSAETIEKVVSKTPNIRKLKCIFSDENRRFPILDTLSQLETLKVVFMSNVPAVGLCKLNFPTNLMKLTLCKFPLPPDEISVIAKLVKLEVLKLKQVSFENDEWEVRDDEFPKLKLLKLENLKLSAWTVSDDAFCCLEKLVLHRCSDLEEIPSGFEDQDYLQYIEVKSCSESLADSAKNISEARVDYGHKCDFEVFN